MAKVEGISLWLVLSPDCDCVRGKCIKLAPVFSAEKEDEDYGVHKGNLALAFKLSSPKFFPVGGDILNNGADGYYADLSEPYFLQGENKYAAGAVFSLNKEGWHLLNAFLKESETRADIVEGERLRTTKPKLHSVPQN